ncbi:CoF synthetase [Aquimarina sp. W85]|uniref:CoF synthetase n=1 Tax=Aquimarina rhodophyticola TaxID=3342246 RepID=UPI00367129F8
MKFSELLRNKAFWLMDAIKAGVKKKHYNDIKFIIENPLAERSVVKKKEYLKNLLTHATSTTSYYKEYIKYQTIEDFPVINKGIIKEKFKEFESSEYLNKKRFPVQTSGSTGTPFMAYQNAKKRLRNTADNIYFSELAGFKIGYQLTYFRLWNAFEKKSFITKWLQNVVAIDVFHLTQDSLKKQILDKLRHEKSTVSWLGYASAYEEICKYMDRKKIMPIPGKIKSMIAMSEKLNEYTIQSIHKYFGADVVSRYSNVENGIIAQQPLGDAKHFIINEASYYVEILDLKSNTPVQDGKPGRIVITDLFNYSMPMIRYDTGDVGVKDFINGKAVFTNVQGRKRDIITNADGDIILANLVFIFNKYLELKQCQMIQKDHGVYVFKLNTDKKFDREDEFIEEFKLYLGASSKITIEYVDDIPLLASGKRRVMVNEML